MIFDSSHFQEAQLQQKHSFECQINATGNDRVLSLHQKEVCFETGLSLAVFSNPERQTDGHSDPNVPHLTSLQGI